MRSTLLALLILCSAPAIGQFYQGMNQDFGKNRVQFDEFVWQYYPYDRFRVYFYTGGKASAQRVADIANQTLVELESQFDFYFDDEDRFHFVVYNKMEHYRQSNIGLLNDTENNIGGVTRIEGSNVFLYLDGSHPNIKQQIRSGISHIIIHQMMYGSNWREVAKNSALLSIPQWYIEGLISYTTTPWNSEMTNFMYQAVESGKYAKYSHLYGDYPVNSGHALWNYIGQTYGYNVIPNILYMTRISRNVESGFLFILGESLKKIIADSEAYYTQRYNPGADPPVAVAGTGLEKRWKKHREYTQFAYNQDRSKVAFATVELGQKKIYILDTETGKKDCIFKQDPKLMRIDGDGYPLLQWHPKGKHLSFIREKRGEILYALYEVETGELTERNMFSIEKVLSYDFSPNGKQLVLSGLKEGESDIFVYNVGPKTMEQLTHDVYDDLYPKFAENGSAIYFSSNRKNDTLKAENNQMLEGYDLFSLDYENKKQVLLRLTPDQPGDEIKVLPLDSGRFMYLSDHTGLSQKYLGTFDSVLSHVDTALHFRYTTEIKQLSEYRRNVNNIVHQNDQKYLDEIVETRDFHPLRSIDKWYPGKPVILESTGSPDGPEGVTSWDHVFQFPPAEQEDIVTNYVFEDEVDLEQPEQKGESKKPEIVPVTSALGAKALKTPNIRNYLVSYTASDIIGQFDFNFANQLYQPFNGGPYIPPGMGTVTKIVMKDLLENHVIEGGIRYSFNNNNMEYFMSYENLEKRLDKKYGLQRQTITQFYSNAIVRSNIHAGTYRLKFPFNEVSAISGEAVLRYDKNTVLTTDRNTLMAPDIHVGWTGLKLEYVYDNTRPAGLNLRYGARMKAWGEHYREATNNWTDFTVIGIDARHYQKIWKNMIFASRFAASSSFGTRKLVYYLGAIDNWVVLSDRPKFNFETNIDNDKGYFYQTLATPIRGFSQNIRNGNNFALINAEVRIPLFQMMFTNPIRSDFINHLQFIGFGDIGSAWTGSNPYSEDNTFNNRTIQSGPLLIQIKNMKDPIVGSYGFGVRSRLWGYFMKLDYAWAVEDRVIQNPSLFLSLGLDF